MQQFHVRPSGCHLLSRVAFQSCLDGVPDGAMFKRVQIKICSQLAVQQQNILLIPLTVTPAAGRSTASRNVMLWCMSVPNSNASPGCNCVRNQRNRLIILRDQLPMPEPM